MLSHSQRVKCEGRFSVKINRKYVYYIRDKRGLFEFTLLSFVIFIPFIIPQSTYACAPLIGHVTFSKANKNAVVSVSDSRGIAESWYLKTRRPMQDLYLFDLHNAHLITDLAKEKTSNQFGLVNPHSLVRIGHDKYYFLIQRRDNCTKWEWWTWHPGKYIKRVCSWDGGLVRQATYNNNLHSIVLKIYDGMESISLMSLSCRVTPIIHGSIPKIINQDNKGDILYTRDNVLYRWEPSCKCSKQLGGLKDIKFVSCSGYLHGSFYYAGPISWHSTRTEHNSYTMGVYQYTKSGVIKVKEFSAKDSHCTIADGKLFYTGDNEYSLYALNIKDKKETRLTNPGHFDVASGAVDGRILFVGDDNKIGILDLAHHTIRYLQ